MLVLQVLSALLLLLNKYFVRKNKAIGWILGIVGTLCITAYFYLQMIFDPEKNLWIMVIYDLALVVLMVYGYLVARSKKDERMMKLLLKQNFAIKLPVIGLTIVVCVYLLIQAITAQLIVVQFLSAVGGLTGTLLVAFKKRKTNMFGWAVYFITHLLVTYLMLKTDSPFIAACQIFSAWVAILGFRDEVQNGKKSKKEALLPQQS